MSGTGQVSAPATGDQFYVTHCVTADSVMNAPGYSVRAASVAGDAEALRLALEYPPYELPLELWRDKPTKAQAPRRLARTPHPRGGVWAVHSVYLEKDTMNRDRSYFSHLIHLPATVDAATVLRSWDSPGWIKEYASRAEKSLPRTRLPAGGAISDETLVAFLSGSPSGPSDLAVVVCPHRLRGDAATRRELVLRFLHGVILANQDDDGRDRLFVHAEPGLTAMLLYAAARILPPAWMADLTFSTFEPAHRGLRDFQLAAVIGTYSCANGKGLDPDLVSAHGYGLDTLHPERSSREIAGAYPSGLTELVDLAAAGEWDLLADVHRLIGNDADALDRVSKMAPLARSAQRLNANSPTIDDLLALRADPRGNAALTQRAEQVWPHLRAAALADRRIRAAFKEWLGAPARLVEFRGEAVQALVKGDLPGWDCRWAVVQEAGDARAARAQLEAAVKSLDDELPNLPLAARDRLRSACLGVGVLPDHHLLAPTSDEELPSLLASERPPEWQGYTCFAVMAPDDKNWLLPATEPIRPILRENVRRHLLAAPPAVLAGYLQQASRFISEEPAFLYDLLRPHSPASAAFLDRLIEGGAAIVPAADWLKLLAELNVYNAPEWQGFLFQNDHLAKLLAGFRADPAATKIWGDYLDLLSAELFDGDEWELTLYDQLKKARAALGAAGIPLRSVLPDGGAAKLNAIDLVFAVMANPASAERLGPGELPRAFQFFWPNDPLAALRRVYSAGRLDTLSLPADARKLDGLIAAFLACFPISHEFFSARTAVGCWLALSESCPPLTRAAFQVYFLQKCVPREWYGSLLNEERRLPFLPEAEARLRESLVAPVTTPSQGYSPLEDVTASEEESEAAFTSTVTRRAKKSRGHGRGAARRSRANTSSMGVWAVIIVGLIVAAVLIAAVIRFSGGRARPTEPEEPAHKASAQPAHKDVKPQTKQPK